MRKIFIGILFTAVVLGTVTKKIIISPANTPKLKEIAMTAKKWAFEPGEIRLKKGEKVKLKIKSVDVKRRW